MTGVGEKSLPIRPLGDYRRSRKARISGGLDWVNIETVNAQCDSASFLIVAHHETISKSLFATKMVPPKQANLQARSSAIYRILPEPHNRVYAPFPRSPSSHLRDFLSRRRPRKPN